MTKKLAEEHMKNRTGVFYTDKEGKVHKCSILWISYPLVGISFVTNDGIKNVIVGLEAIHE